MYICCYFVIRTTIIFLVKYSFIRRVSVVSEAFMRPFLCVLNIQTHPRQLELLGFKCCMMSLTMPVSVKNCQNQNLYPEIPLHRLSKFQYNTILWNNHSLIITHSLFI